MSPSSKCDAVSLSLALCFTTQANLLSSTSIFSLGGGGGGEETSVDHVRNDARPGVTLLQLMLDK